MTPRPASPLLLAGLVLAALSIVTAHPLFAIGIWHDAEPVACLFLLAAAVTAGGLALSLAGEPGNARALGHPAVLACASLGLWSLLAAPFAQFPMLSILGPPQTAEGALRILAFAVLIAAALTLRDHPRLFDAVLATAAFAALLGPVAGLMGFNDHVGHASLALLAIGAGLAQARRWPLAAVMLGCGIETLILSHNRTAWVAAAAGAVVFASARWLPHVVRLRVLLAAGAAFAGFAPWLAVRLLPTPDSLPTLASRKVLLRVLEPSLLDGLVTGHGWGHYAEHLARNLPLAVVRTYRSEWQDVIRDEFHSHASLLEALFAAGLPGLLATMALPAMVVLGARRPALHLAAAFAIAWALLDGAWFTMPSSLALLALAIAFLSETPARPIPRPLGFGTAVGIAATALASLAAAGALLLHGRTMTRLEACLPPHGFAAPCEGISIPGDPRGAELGLASLLATSTAAMPDALRPPATGQGALMRRLMEESRRREQAGAALQLAMARYNAHAKVMVENARNPDPAYDAFFAPWRDDALAILARAPHRIDILPAYLNILLAKGREEELAEMVARAERLAPRHPVTLWFGGVVMLRSSDERARQQGLDRMRRALAEGLENFMPVPQRIKEQLAK